MKRDSINFKNLLQCIIEMGINNDRACQQQILNNCAINLRI